MSKSDFLENSILDDVLQTGDPAANLWIGLSTADPGDNGAGFTEPGGGSYARLSFDPGPTNWNAAAAGQASNKLAAIFAEATGSWGDLKWWGIWSAVSGGNLLYWGPLYSGSVLGYAIAADDYIYSKAHGFSDTNQIHVHDIGLAFPGALTEGTVYYVVSAATDRFKLSLSSGGAAVSITTDGHCRVGIQKHVNISSGEAPAFQAGTLVINED